MLYNETLCYNDLSVWLPDGSLNNSAVDLSCFVTDSANYNPKDYVWIVAFGAICSFVMAYGIGANDVANAFATSVGSKTLKLWQAVCIAAVLEFSGSLMGAQVTQTIAKGITDPLNFVDEPAVLMLGMLTALMGAGGWVLIATRLGLPVSTTHAIVGAIVGFAMASQGPSSIDWVEFGLIVSSWVISPVLTGLVSASIFYLVRRFILRSSDSLNRGFLFYPFLVLVTITINVFFIVDHGPAVFKMPYEWQAFLIALACGVGVAIVIHFTFIPWLKGRVQRYTWGPRGAIVASEYGTIPEPTGVNGDAENGHAHGETSEEQPKGDEKKADPANESFFSAHWKRMMGDDLEETAFANDDVKAMHESAEVFDNKTEHIFSYLQVVTACFMSFAHGSNDVANSVGPFSAIYYTYNSAAACNVNIDVANGGELSCGDSPVEVWVLALGGFGIVIGLLTYGYHVMRSIGMELIKITPARGFCIEFSSATTVIVASMLEIPVSSTQCQVGSTVAVGMLEGKSGFNWFLFVKTFASWIFTIIFSSLVTAAVFSFAHFAP